MAVLSFSNALHPELKSNIFVDLMKKGWIAVLSDSSIKLLIYFSYIRDLGDTLIGDYNEIMLRTDMARGSVSKGILELETFGFICVRKKIGKTKLYELCNNVIALNGDWRKFFSKNAYKKTCIDILNGASLSNEVIEKLYADIEYDKNSSLVKTLGKLLYLYMNKKNFNIHDLIGEELTGVDEVLFTDEWGFGEPTKKENSWLEYLTDEEKNNKNFMKIVECFEANVNIPNEEDIIYMRKAYSLCFPHQVTTGILVRKGHPTYGPKFTRFKYLYTLLKKGMYGTRIKNKLKQDDNGFNKQYNKQFNKPYNKNKNNQTQVGFKTTGKSRTEIIDVLDSESKSKEEGPFDFTKLQQ